jgi:hypothetical protein
MSNIGSGGVFLKAQNPLPVGQQVELFLNWPAMLDGRCPLRLVIQGQAASQGRASHTPTGDGGMSTVLVVDNADVAFLGASGYLVDSGAMSRPPQWK